MSTDGGDMGKAPAFQFYAADFLVGTRHMFNAEVGLYIRMLAMSWDTGPLPADPARLALVAGVTPEEFAQHWPEVSKKWVLTPEGYINERLERQRRELAEFTERQAAKGRRSGESRRTRTQPNANRTRTGSEPEVNREPTEQPTEHEPETNSSVFSLQSSTKESKEHSLSSEAKPSDLMAAWNSGTTPPIPKCRELTPSRRKHSIARLREAALDVWVDVIERIEASAFCRGQTDRGGWVATFDWLLQQDTRVKVLEGKYDNRPRGEPGFTAGDKASRTMAAAEHVIALQLAQRKAVGDGT